VGGPATTGPGRTGRSADFLRQFLQHCQTAGTPLDFITYHAKGSPRVVEGHVRMGISNNVSNVAAGLDIVAAFPQYRNLPIILTESDPEGCAACSARVYPQNAYRNTPLYASYTAVMIDSIAQLAARSHANIEGMLTWAFEFEDQPYFDGLRTLATNGIDKPVLNLFRMAGLLEGARLPVESTGARGLDSILIGGVRESPYIGALATRAGRRVAIMAWNYHDDDLPAPPSDVRLTVAGLPAEAGRVLLRHYRIDDAHSNAFTAWKQMGAPQQPTADQYARLEAAGQLELLESPRWVDAASGAVDLAFPLPRQGVSLIELSW
jgi:xylan 1,4-beta-xylosidase